MGDVARAFSKIRPDLSISIIGATPDDMSLMRNANTFVTGAVEAKDIKRLAASLGLERIFISTTRPLFGHPITSAIQSCSLPIAYFDWSKGRGKPHQDDLAIDPNASLDELVDALSAMDAATVKHSGKITSSSARRPRDRLAVGVLPIG